MKLITFIVLGCIASAVSCERTDSEAANASAREFIKNMPGSTGVVCADTDTDGDGYVTCTVFRGTQEPLQIQCGSQRWCVANCARGCKYQSLGKLYAPPRPAQ